MFYIFKIRCSAYIRLKCQQWLPFIYFLFPFIFKMLDQISTKRHFKNSQETNSTEKSIKFSMFSQLSVSLDIFVVVYAYVTETFQLWYL